MRISSIAVPVLLLILQIQAAAPTVSGFSVAARWVGLYYGDNSGAGDIMRYDITNGALTKTTLLYHGTGRFATISPDGRKVAFFRDGANALAIMDAAGGTPVDVVTGLPPRNTWVCPLDWPSGDWVYYGYKTDPNWDYTAQIWKVNVNTKQTQKVCVFNANAEIWQFSISNDGAKAAIRGTTDPINGGCFRVMMSDTIHANWNDPTTIIGAGCGSAVSPDGAYVTYMDNTDHIRMIITHWDLSVPDTIILTDMSAWTTTPFTLPGQGGMNSQRWSANDPKWLCMNVGWEARYGNQGSNQILVNWVDHQVVRTSQDTALLAGQDRFTATENETGDFWVGNPAPVTTQVVKPVMRPGRGAASPAFAGGSKGTSVSATVFDINGRAHNNSSVKQGVYCVQCSWGGKVRAQKLIIKN